MQTLSLFYLILLQEKNDENKLKYFVLACEKLQMSPIVYYYWLLNLHAKHFSLLKEATDKIMMAKGMSANIRIWNEEQNLVITTNSQEFALFIKVYMLKIFI